MLDLELELEAELLELIDSLDLLLLNELLDSELLDTELLDLELLELDLELDTELLDSELTDDVPTVSGDEDEDEDLELDIEDLELDIEEPKELTDELEIILEELILEELTYTCTTGVPGDTLCANAGVKVISPVVVSIFIISTVSPPTSILSPTENVLASAAPIVTLVAPWLACVVTVPVPAVSEDEDEDLEDSEEPPLNCKIIESATALVIKPSSTILLIASTELESALDELELLDEKTESKPNWFKISLAIILSRAPASTMIIKFSTIAVLEELILEELS